MPSLEQWHGNQGDRLRSESQLPRERRLQRGDSLSQHASQNVRGGTHAVVFEQVDKFAQSPVITAVGDSAREWALDTAAHGTAPLTVGFEIGVRRQHNLAANRANFPVYGSHTIQAIEANW